MNIPELAIGMSSQKDSELAAMAEHFYGYGRWDTPFWFIGPEAGMGKDGIDSIAARFESWQRLGGGGVVDCAAHHRGFGFTKWHDPRPPTQPTWRQLIRLLLAYKGEATGVEVIRTYQWHRWGSEVGETCVIELSGVPAPNMGIAQDRTSFLSRRIERIRQEALKNAPAFIVMYGQGNRGEWEQIAGSKFDANGICRMGNTIAATALHPVTRGLGNEYWVKLGQLMRKTKVQDSP